MYAITIRQPMAFAIANLDKRVENRGRVSPWSSHIGTTMALHAGRTWDPNQAADVAAISGHRLYPDDVTFGALTATFVLADVHWSADGCCGDWAQHDTFDSRAHLVVDLVRRLTEPVACRGALGPWRVPTDTARLLEQVRR